MANQCVYCARCDRRTIADTCYGHLHTSAPAVVVVVVVVVVVTGSSPVHLVSVYRLWLPQQRRACTHDASVGGGELDSVLW